MCPAPILDPARVPVMPAASLLRIAFAMINCNRRDGSARAVNEVAERLADQGHEVYLYARKAEDIDLRKVQWRRMPGPGWPEVADFSSYHWLANRRLAHTTHDIIHSIGCNTLRANVVTIQNIQPAKQKVLARLSHAQQEHVSAPRRFTRALYYRVTCAAERRLYTHRRDRDPLLFLPVSRGVAQELRDYYDIGPAQLRIVPNAADVNRFKLLSPAQRAAWREANGIAADDLMLLFAGGEWMRKGLDYAIRALAMLPMPKVRLYVAGDDPDRARFMALAQELGCRERVVFGGFRRDMAEVMGAADVFLFPSWYEAFSLVVIEAAACGLPVLATRINGSEDFVKPGENGEFIEPDAAQIASVLRPLCENPETLRQMGEAGRRCVERDYTWDRVTAMTVEAYREYLESRREQQ